jgi:hypothetical protein
MAQGAAHTGEIARVVLVADSQSDVVERGRSVAVFGLERLPLLTEGLGDGAHPDVPDALALGHYPGR